LDALAANREGGESDATSGVQSRILTTLLNEIDGISNAGGEQGILVVAATNRLDAIDAALLRPGRLEEHILLSHPKSSSIYEIIMIHTAKMPIDVSVDLKKFSDLLEGSTASCAEIEGICRDACLIAIRRCSEGGTLNNLSVSTSDFYDAYRRIKKRNTHTNNNSKIT
jgi:ATP-dependent 26S proteasome regulatory subunit